MASPKTNYFIDFLMIILFIVIAITGLILFFPLPLGIKQGSAQTFLGITKGTLSFIHNWGGIIFIVLIILRFVFHWDWIAGMTKNIFWKK